MGDSFTDGKDSCDAAAEVAPGVWEYCEKSWWGGHADHQVGEIKWTDPENEWSRKPLNGKVYDAREVAKDNY